MAYNVFWGECMPDLFHSSKAPCDLCLTQDLDEIVNTQGGHDLQKSLHIKKINLILNG